MRIRLELVHTVMGCLSIAIGEQCAIAQQSEVVYWPPNGHMYEVRSFVAGISWAQARIVAEGLGGHLVTITSSEENELLIAATGDDAYWVTVGLGDRGPWIGGYQPAGSEEPGDAWMWITGEAFDFQAWADDEPNNAGSGNEDALHFGRPFSFPELIGWNDLPQDAGPSNPRSALIEYPQGPRAGNANYDGRVNLADFEILKRNFGEAGGWTEGDFDGSGIVNLPDFSLLKANFNKRGIADPIQAAPVPEPSMLALLLSVVFAVLGYGMCCVVWRAGLVALLVFSLPLLPATPVLAQSTQASAWLYLNQNAHMYEVRRVNPPVAWSEARDLAEAAGGYLATLTSSQENDAVFQLADRSNAFWEGQSGPWLGGWQPHPNLSIEPAGGWEWVTGEPWQYRNWAPGQPDNHDIVSGEPEHFLHFWVRSPQWNDAPAVAGLRSFVTEYPTIPPVRGDFNLDLVVDIVDFSILKSHFGDRGRFDEGDASGDGTIDLTDFSILRQVFGRDVPTPGMEEAVPVPEPSSRVLLLSALAGLACWRWRGRRARPFARAIGVTALLFCTLTNYSHAVPTEWEVNGHWYAVARRTGPWELANTRSEEAGGYLATITSAPENDFVFQLVEDPNYWGDLGGGPIGPWLGGFQDALAENEPALGWQWVTGEPYEYENWLAGEPNNAGGAENWLVLGGLVGQSSPVSTWGDAPSPFNPVRSFIVEWNTLPRFAFGDLDGNGTVGLPDFSILKEHFGQRVSPTEGDITLDGGVNLADFNVMKQYFGTSLGDLSPVPEPGTGVLAYLAATFGCIVHLLRLPLWKSCRIRTNRVARFGNHETLDCRRTFAGMPELISDEFVVGSLETVGDTMFISGFGSDVGNELWKSDGTAE